MSKFNLIFQFDSVKTRKDFLDWFRSDGMLEYWDHCEFFSKMKSLSVAHFLESFSSEEDEALIMMSPTYEELEEEEGKNE